MPLCSEHVSAQNAPVGLRLAGGHTIKVSLNLHPFAYAYAQRVEACGVILIRTEYPFIVVVVHHDGQLLPIVGPATELHGYGCAATHGGHGTYRDACREASVDDVAQVVDASGQAHGVKEAGVVAVYAGSAGWCLGLGVCLDGHGYHGVGASQRVVAQREVFTRLTERIIEVLLRDIHAQHSVVVEAHLVEVHIRRHDGSQFHLLYFRFFSQAQAEHVGLMKR